ncbi:unnamed protein product, partial [Musa acuminata subsp. burmannicoides]
LLLLPNSKTTLLLLPPLEATEWADSSASPLGLPNSLQLRLPLTRSAPHQRPVFLLQRLCGDEPAGTVAALFFEEFIGDSDLKRPRRRLLDVEGPEESTLPGAAGGEEGGGEGDEGEDGVEEVGGEEEVGVAGLELVAGIERRDLLADKEGVRAADEVAGVLLHELRRRHWSVVHPDPAVAADEPDPFRLDRRSRASPAGGRRPARQAHHVEAPWDHLQIERLPPHLRSYDLSPRTHAVSMQHD